MDESYLKSAVTELRRLGERFAPGLTDTEIALIETRYDFRFPLDVRTFLQYAMPVSKSWVNWRKASEKSLQERLTWPVEGICFDVEHNGFWMESWGEKPADLYDALTIAREKVAQAPPLFPLYSHRYIPSEPMEAGNPIFSVYQTDIIYYGYDLASYLTAEFGITQTAWAKTAPRPISFWDELVSGSVIPAITDEKTGR